MLTRVHIARTITSQQQVRNSKSVRGILIAAKFEFDIHFRDGHTDSTDRPQHLPKRRVARFNQIVISLGLKPLHLTIEQCGYRLWVVNDLRCPHGLHGGIVAGWRCPGGVGAFSMVPVAGDKDVGRDNGKRHVG